MCVCPASRHKCVTTTFSVISQSRDLPSQDTVAKQHPLTLLPPPPPLSYSIKQWLRGWRGDEREQSLFIEAVGGRRGNYVLRLKLNLPSPPSLFLAFYISLSLLCSLSFSGRFIHRCSEEKDEIKWQGCMRSVGVRSKKTQLWDIIQYTQRINLYPNMSNYTSSRYSCISSN